MTRVGELDWVSTPETMTLVHHGSKMPLGDAVQIAHQRYVVDGPPCSERHPAARRDHPPHLTGGRRLVREELKS